MGANTEIMTACFDRLLTFSNAPDPNPEILWPEITDDPPDSGFWLEPGYFPNENGDLYWDNDGCVDTRGFFQVLVYYRTRPDLGQVIPSTLADKIIDHFPKGTALGPVRVRKRPSQGPKVDEKGKSYIPVTISYMGLT